MATALAERSVQANGPRDRLLEMIREKSLLKGTSFRLSSGEISSVFFNMKMTMLDPEGANLIADAILERPELSSVDVIGGMAMGAVPIVAVVSARSYYRHRRTPAFFVRKEIKGHGTNKLIEGHFCKGQKAVLVDDVTTTGSSVLSAVQAARDAGCIVDVVITVVDRLQGAKENLARHGVRLVALYTRQDFEF